MVLLACYAVHHVVANYPFSYEVVLLFQSKSGVTKIPCLPSRYLFIFLRKEHMHIFDGYIR